MKIVNVKKKKMKGDEYVILEELSAEKLDEQINVYFFHGYLPDGNIVIFVNKGGGVYYVQRMKKKSVGGT